VEAEELCNKALNSLRILSKSKLGDKDHDATIIFKCTALLAQIYLMQDKSEEGASILNKGLESLEVTEQSQLTACYALAATILFETQQYAEAEPYYDHCLKINSNLDSNAKKDLYYAILNDVASVKVERSKTEEAGKLHKQLREGLDSLTAYPPLTNSKCLRTIECFVAKRIGLCYTVKFELKINRKSAHEEYFIPVGSVLEFNFDNPADPSEPIIELFKVQATTPKRVDITSKVFTTVHNNPDKKYGFTINIWNDDTKTTKIGSHFQLCSFVPDPTDLVLPRQLHQVVNNI